MKEFIYLGIVVLVILAITAFEKVKNYFKPKNENYFLKQSVIGITYWVPVKKGIPRKAWYYPSPELDFIDEWVNSLECSEVVVSGKKIYVIDQADVDKLREIIRYKHGYILY